LVSALDMACSRHKNILNRMTRIASCVTRQAIQINDTVMK
jgi:hypothetical protein